MGALEQAFLAAARVGECAGFEAEEFAFEQGVGQRGTVQFQQRHGSARAGVVNGFGEDALCRCRFRLESGWWCGPIRRPCARLRACGEVGFVLGDDFAEVVAAA